MSGYIGINLRDILLDSTLGENVAKSLLSSFYCPMNPDVEHFLKQTAIEFTKQGISSTHLVMASYQDRYVLVGYFSLANKIFCIEKDSLPNRTWKNRMKKFGQFDQTIQRYTISAPLIGQLGKNYANSYDKLITGDELLKLALDKVREMQAIVGGKIVYLECEDKEPLLDFYSQNGFVNFGKRTLDKDETSTLSGEYLIQMLRYM
ncbi:MAG: N-acetyltransferase [Lachnospiraceae bacterium]|nr:N-acetyltransferase [Lachnospiraceae bacterium]